MSKFKPVAGLVAALALAGCGGEPAENGAADELSGAVSEGH
jgi:hypothetical protein